MSRASHSKSSCWPTKTQLLQLSLKSQPFCCPFSVIKPNLLHARFMSLYSRAVSLTASEWVFYLFASSFVVLAGKQL